MFLFGKTIEEIRCMIIIGYIQPETPQTCCKLWILPAWCKSSTNCSKSVDFIKLCHLNLNILPSWTWYLQTCCKLLEHLASSFWIKLSLGNQLAASLLTTCSILVIYNQAGASLQQTCCNQGRLNEKRAREANFVGGHRQNFNRVKIHTWEFSGSVAFMRQVFTHHILSIASAITLDINPSQIYSATAGIIIII